MADFVKEVAALAHLNLALSSNGQRRAEMPLNVVSRILGDGCA